LIKRYKSAGLFSPSAGTSRQPPVRNLSSRLARSQRRGEAQVDQAVQISRPLLSLSRVFAPAPGSEPRLAPTALLVSPVANGSSRLARSQRRGEAQIDQAVPISPQMELSTSPRLSVSTDSRSDGGQIMVGLPLCEPSLAAYPACREGRKLAESPSFPRR
jgi:hypothetical protein